MFKPIALLIAGASLLALVPLPARSADVPHKPYVVLDRGLDQLRADFNANRGKVRMLYIVGPSCGICLRALSDLEDSLYSKQGNDPRMVTFVVHVPTLGAQEANVTPASRLITNAYTTNYWEDTGIIGKLMEQTLGIDKYVWDFYAIYGPTATWSAERPPVPDFYQHQMAGLPREKYLDADVFARKVDGFLDLLPTARATGATAGRVNAPGTIK